MEELSMLREEKELIIKRMYLWLEINAEVKDKIKHQKQVFGLQKKI